MCWNASWCPAATAPAVLTTWNCAARQKRQTFPATSLRLKASATFFVLLRYFHSKAPKRCGNSDHRACPVTGLVLSGNRCLILEQFFLLWGSRVLTFHVYRSFILCKVNSYGSVFGDQMENRKTRWRTANKFDAISTESHLLWSTLLLALVRSLKPRPGLNFVCPTTMCRLKSVKCPEHRIMIVNIKCRLSSF
jgi:hypothetical protein